MYVFNYRTEGKLMSNDYYTKMCMNHDWIKLDHLSEV